MSLRSVATILPLAGCIFEAGPGEEPTWPIYTGQDDTPDDTDGGPNDTDTPQYASDPVTAPEAGGFSDLSLFVDLAEQKAGERLMLSDLSVLLWGGLPGWR